MVANRRGRPPRPHSIFTHPYQSVDSRREGGGANRGCVSLRGAQINRGPLIMEKRVRQRGLGEEEGAAREVDSDIMRSEERVWRKQEEMR